MADDKGTEDPGVGGPVRHVPVLLREVVGALAPTTGDLIVDGTFGAGGYASALLAEGAEVLAIDRDPTAIAAGQALVDASAGRLTLVSGRFSELDAIAAARHPGGVDGVVLDIGVSSMQIDAAERGFSFQKDGPLDMRMAGAGPGSGASAADVVNTLKHGDLARVLGFYGEERQAGRIAGAILKRRAERPFERTLDLAEVIGRVVGRSPKDKIDPATRSFQALRIYVNDELGELARALAAAERVLKPGGRLVVVTFHSLEDRIVKRFFKDRSTQPTASRHLPDVSLRTLTFAASNKAAAATDEEAARNPRARSAKLRLGIRTDAPPRTESDALSFADLPKLADLPETGD